MTAKGWKEEDICMYLSNGWLSPVTIKVNFVDGTITNDSDQKKACQPESTKERFGKYISLPKTEYRLQPQQSLEVHATAEFPVSYAGMAYGCVTYQAVGENEATNWMFSVLTRKANFIDILVEGKIELWLSIKDQTRDDNLWKSSQLLIFKDLADGLYKAQLFVTNDGNIAQQVTISGSVAVRFKDFVLPEQSKKVLPGDSVDFMYVLDDYIPRYEGAITTNIDLTNTPVFEFESDQITDEMRTSNTQTISSSFVIAPWKLLAGLIALFLVLFAGTRYMKNRSWDRSETSRTTTKFTKRWNNQDEEMMQEQQQD